jgi:hypothetical protein
MAVTVDIIIKGIAICYQKGNNWQVLFPVDKEGCHKIDFSSKDQTGSPVTSLAKKADSIEITAKGATSETGADENFVQDVYDLTSEDTHGKVRLKEEAGRYVSMTIPNAHFSINEVFVGQKGQKLADLVDIKHPKLKKPVKRLANSVKGTITLNDGGHVTVKAGEFSFTTDGSHTLIFDNDCEKVKVGRNDMDMFYEIIEEFDPVSEEKIDRQFRIGGVGVASKKSRAAASAGFGVSVEGSGGGVGDLGPVPFKDPPGFASGNTCMFAIVSDEESISKLPPFPNN